MAKNAIRSEKSIHIIRLIPDEDLYLSLIAYAKHQKKHFVLLQLLGSLKKLRIRFANALQYFEAEKNYEIICGSGFFNAQEGHFHGLFCDSNGKPVGGHFREGLIVKTTAEVALLEVTQEWKREIDGNTGYKEMVLLK